MSELGKRIGRVVRREAPGGFGFGMTKRESPRAMVLAAAAGSVEEAKAALEAGADVVVIEGLDAVSAAGVAAQLDKTRVGVRLDSLDEADASALAPSVDFIIAPLATTTSAAVDTERTGHIVSVDLSLSDTTLRSLAPLGLDGLFVQSAANTTTLAEQLEFVRLSSLSGSPLAVTVDPNASVTIFRVLRDSGVAIALAPRGASGNALRALSETLKAVPAPKRSKQGGELALVPSAGGHAHEDDDEVEEPE